MAIAITMRRRSSQRGRSVQLMSSTVKFLKNRAKPLKCGLTWRCVFFEGSFRATKRPLFFVPALNTVPKTIGTTPSIASSILKIRMKEVPFLALWLVLKHQPFTTGSSIVFFSFGKPRNLFWCNVTLESSTWYWTVRRVCQQAMAWPCSTVWPTIQQPIEEHLSFYETNGLRWPKGESGDAETHQQIIKEYSIIFLCSYSGSMSGFFRTVSARYNTQEQLDEVIFPKDMLANPNSIEPTSLAARVGGSTRWHLGRFFHRDPGLDDCPDQYQLD